MSIEITSQKQFSEVITLLLSKKHMPLHYQAKDRIASGRWDKFKFLAIKPDEGTIAGTRSLRGNREDSIQDFYNYAVKVFELEEVVMDDYDLV